VVLGCALAAVGFWLWSSHLADLDLGKQVWFVILSGAGMGFMLGLSYGEATGITQTVRNYAASLGIAVFGSLSISSMHSRLTTSLVGQGLPRKQADSEAIRISQAHSATGAIPTSSASTSRTPRSRCSRRWQA
jgi:hypothetical protein